MGRGRQMRLSHVPHLVGTAPGPHFVSLREPRSWVISWLPPHHQFYTTVLSEPPPTSLTQGGKGRRKQQGTLTAHMQHRKHETAATRGLVPSIHLILQPLICHVSCARHWDQLDCFIEVFPGPPMSPGTWSLSTATLHLLIAGDAHSRPPCSGTVSAHFCPTIPNPGPGRPMVGLLP